MSTHMLYVFRPKNLITFSCAIFTILAGQVAEQSKAWTVFICADAVIVGSNPSQDMDVSCVYVFILCLCCPVFR
jgi:hypothetical protein